MNQCKAKLLRRISTRLQNQKHTKEAPTLRLLGTGQFVWPNDYWRRIYRKLKQMDGEK